MEGWIRLHRCLCDNKFWCEKPFSRGQAWVDLLLIANHKPGHVRKRGIRVEIKRGQVGMSIKGLAAKWGWSRGKVKRFLDELEMDQQIEQQNNKVTTVISLINYEKYQEADIKTGNRRATDGQQTDTNNNDKNEKKERGRVPKGAHPLPENFSISEEMISWAKGIGIENGKIQGETDKFRDYWKGAGKTKTDWVATWRNWIRRAVEMNPALTAPPAQKNIGGYEFGR